MASAVIWHIKRRSWECVDTLDMDFLYWKPLTNAYSYIIISAKMGWRYFAGSLWMRPFLFTKY